MFKITQGIIRRLENIPDDLKEIQEFLISEVTNNSDYYINKYKSFESSLNGNYICSDLFKETFDIYAQSIESRKKYNKVVHNSCACLANELFLQKAKDSVINKCLIVAGVPGAGKSFLIQALAMENTFDEKTLIYEGDITTSSIIEKIKYLQDNDKKVFIIVINPSLEIAIRNVINRQFEIGRGASCETMARILTGIPNALLRIKSIFKNIDLAIYNKNSNYDVDYFIGFNNIQCLYYGSYEKVLSLLQNLRLQILEEINQELKNKLGDDTFEKRR